MDNKLMSLSFSMEANKGVYALLLGSGISFSANIPTGWGILKELCRRIMEVSGETHEDPIQWYHDHFNKPATYDEVIEMLAKTSTERVGLLAEFFEPKDDDGEDAKKPTKAHKEIAKLVKNGYIKVIVTTNFDRLMEQALEELNIQYQTLYHESDIQGMKPLAHADCTVLKIHGDYRDTRFKNVSDELKEYPESLTNLLQQVFDEYGIITSGWSAEWDTALRDTIKSVKSRRYSWYWHAFNETLSPQAEELLKFRDGTKIVDSEGADNIFSLLSENVESISKLKKTNPENIQMKIKKLKKFITNDLEIELREMITEETQTLVLFVKSLDYNANVNPETMKIYIEQIKEKTHTLSIMLTILTYYAKDKKHESLICETIERLTTAEANEGMTKYICFSKFPAIIGLYSVGIAAVMKKNYKLLNKFFTEISMRSNLYGYSTFIEFTGSNGEIYTTFKDLYPLHQAPFEEMFLHPFMCEVYANSKLTFDERELNNYYDTFELLLALKHHYINSSAFSAGIFGNKLDRSYISDFLKSGAQEKENWQVLELFDNSVDNFTNSLIKLTNILNYQGHFMGGKGLLDSYKTVI
ncbi:hypothetical protein C3496_10475 [Bacillus anthracis]|uniref:SIR2 family protein n=1 Tax=Bacillus TaxID=1386 RepID=UPI0010A600CF|nr:MULTISPECIES: SIR2 family protein [Bacillus]QBJ66776.1 hypothetical protein C3496_10475 [Bacillus anthracis]THG62946.1 hypothetical protein E7Y01_04150 [Bacillus sp. HUB-I-004]